MDSNAPHHVSFIGIVDFTEDARWLYASESAQDLLGFEPHELIGHPSLDLVHPDEFPQIRALHYSTIKQDKAAVLVYLRMRHKDPCKGYILCCVTRTVCQNVLVGSVSFAAPGPRAMHNNSTAQEVTVVTPYAKDFEFRRWHDPSPMPPCPVPGELAALSPSDPPTPPLRYDPLPEQSRRTALILDRFSERCGILYCANDSILPTTKVMGRSFFDFVMPKDESVVRNWIEVVKGWGVNERGQPSDGGFGFGKFAVCTEGRDSSLPNTDAPAPKHRDRLNSRARDRPSHSHHSRPHNHSGRDAQSGSSRTKGRTEELIVDAIFSAHSDGLMVILRLAN
ncbi:tRNA (adenine-N(1)-)-methyltransferase catalytic subunit trm61 [Steccherinum ochraceum]|uniref:tRNA (Adenine-N(1)-)-methyltransferase catalytic subunit trm61 n=1 Tax=Steccherinum ochraceum TaxID=92696 RepID=A0A4R0RCT8_9APHY|nr:tRNA (adenine-N(1)-)-methyltransferase catalytic subunit trm61 [Steccherinum ochraceum]